MCTATVSSWVATEAAQAYVVGVARYLASGALVSSSFIVRMELHKQNRHVRNDLTKSVAVQGDGNQSVENTGQHIGIANVP